MPGFSYAVPGKAYVIVSDAVNYVVDVFTTAGVLASQITGLSEPQGLAADPAGDLYIANTSGLDANDNVVIGVVKGECSAKSIPWADGRQ